MTTYTYTGSNITHNFTCDEGGTRYLRLSYNAWLEKVNDTWEYVYDDDALAMLEETYKAAYKHIWFETRNIEIDAPQ